MNNYPIVILPGWLLGAKRYEFLANEFRARGYKTYIVDFQGFEEGDRLTRALSLTDYVKHLQKFLRARKLTKAIFICHSFGGRVGLKLASQNPRLVHALILSGTPGLPGITKLRFYLTVWFAKIGKFISFIPPFLLFRKKLRFFFYRVTRAQDYYRADGLLRETFKNIVKEQLIEYMRKVRVPTLLLWGEKDKLVPVRIARQMQQLLMKSKLVVVPEKGHMFTYRDPQLVCQQVITYLASQSL